MGDNFKLLLIALGLFYVRWTISIWERVAVISVLRVHAANHKHWPPLKRTIFVCTFFHSQGLLQFHFILLSPLSAPSPEIWISFPICGHARANLSSPNIISQTFEIVKASKVYFRTHPTRNLFFGNTTLWRDFSVLSSNVTKNSKMFVFTMPSMRAMHRANSKQPICTQALVARLHLLRCSVGGALSLWPSTEFIVCVSLIMFDVNH